MKITILNGSPQPGRLDACLAELKPALEASGHSVTQLDLRDLTLRCCVGCWGCWVKTPGECSNRDDSPEMGRAVINAEFVLWAAPLKMGFPTELLKRATDKHLPLIHPYMEVDQGEATRVMPPEMNASLFANLQAIGAGLPGFPAPAGCAFLL